MMKDLFINIVWKLRHRVMVSEEWLEDGKWQPSDIIDLCPTVRAATKVADAWNREKGNRTTRYVVETPYSPVRVILWSLGFRNKGRA
jgi:hypothetical protein